MISAQAFLCSRRRALRLISSVPIAAYLSRFLGDKAHAQSDPIPETYIFNGDEKDWNMIFAVSKEILPDDIGATDKNIAIYGYDISLNGTFRLPGKTFLVHASNVRFNNGTVINLTGSDGSPIDTPVGAIAGGNGADGGMGKPGASGGNLILVCSQLSGSGTIIANGGNGGPGQDGGDGAEGPRGQPGPSSLPLGVHGTTNAGGKGGSGGHGGPGGSGGAPGAAYLFFSGKASVPPAIVIQCSPGATGIHGQDGHDGPTGPPGPSEPVSYFDRHGHRINLP
jgi:hypothetical protein